MKMAIPTQADEKATRKVVKVSTFMHVINIKLYLFYRI